MKDMILFVVCSILIGGIIFYTYKSIKKSNSLSEKIINIIILIIVVAFELIFCLDRFNIPTKLNWVENMDTQNWLSFLGEYVTGIVSAIIGVLIAFWTTMRQIKDNNEVNNENLRIQNIPLLKYNCIIDTKPQWKLTVLETNINDDDGVIQSINLSLKNIGLNTIRKTYIKIKNDIFKGEHNFELNDAGVIEKNQEIILPFVLRLITNRTYNFEITVYYQDLLFNVYEQNVLLQYELSSYNDGSKYIFNSKFNVENEKKIGKEFPKFNFEKL